jgi:hypothetical protein
MSKLYTNGLKVNNVNIMQMSLKGWKCQHDTQMAKRLKMSTLYKIS